MSSLKASCCWVSRRITGSSPSPRQGIACVLHKGRIFLFGGSQWNEEEGETTYFQSLHSLSPEKEDLAWTEVKQKGDVPRARESHALNSLDDAIYLMGGKDAEDADACIPGVDKFDVETSTWSQVPCRGAAPSAVGFTASLVRREIYAFGGFLRGRAVNDVHMFYVDTSAWSKLNPSGVPPSPRCDHGAAVVGERVFIVGGCGAQNLYFNDVVVFDSNTLSWRHPRVHGRPPAPRGNFSLASHHDKDVYLFGGTSENADGSSTLFNDVVKLSLVAREAAPFDVFEKVAGRDDDQRNDGAGDNAKSLSVGSEGAAVGTRLYHKLRWRRPIHVGRTIGPLHGHGAVIHKSHMYILGGMNADGETNRVLTLRLLSPSQRVPILDELMQQYESAHALAKPPQLSFDLEVPPFQKPAILEPLAPSTSELSRVAADVRSLKTRAQDAQRTSKEDADEAFRALLDILDKFEKQKIEFYGEKEMFLREKAAYRQQYQDQQNELSLLIQRHKEQMELWIKEQTELYVAQQKRQEDERQEVRRQQAEVAQEKAQLEQSEVAMMHMIRGFR